MEFVSYSYENILVYLINDLQIKTAIHKIFLVDIKPTLQSQSGAKTVYVQSY